MVFCSVYPQENTRPVVERQEPRRSNPDRPPGLFPCSRKMGGGRELGDEQLPHLRHCSSIQSRVSGNIPIRCGGDSLFVPGYPRPCDPQFKSVSTCAVLHALSISKGRTNLKKRPGSPQVRELTQHVTRTLSTMPIGYGKKGNLFHR